MAIGEKVYSTGSEQVKHNFKRTPYADNTMPWIIFIEKKKKKKKKKPFTRLESRSEYAQRTITLNERIKLTAMTQTRSVAYIFNELVEAKLMMNVWMYNLENCLIQFEMQQCDERVCCVSDAAVEKNAWFISISFENIWKTKTERENINFPTFFSVEIPFAAHFVCCCCYIRAVDIKYWHCTSSDHRYHSSHSLATRLYEKWERPHPIYIFWVHSLLLLRLLEIILFEIDLGVYCVCAVSLVFMECRACALSVRLWYRKLLIPFAATAE